MLKFLKTLYKAIGKLVKILYNSYTLSLEKSDTIWLSETPNVPGSMSWDTAHQRVMSWGIFATKNLAEKNFKFLFINTHLDHIGEISRLKSCAVILPEVSKIIQQEKLPVILSGDFNSGKYSNIWNCFTENDFLKDSIHGASNIYNPIQYTFHNFHGIHINSFWLRFLQYMFFGFSCTLPHLWRHRTEGVACFGAPLHTTLYNRVIYNKHSGVHHVDWILHTKKFTPLYFSVLTHHLSRKTNTKYTWLDFFHKRVVESTIYPSDHFPIIVGFNVSET